MSNAPCAYEPISPNLSDSRARIEELFSDCHDLTIKEWNYGQPKLSHHLYERVDSRSVAFARRAR